MRPGCSLSLRVLRFFDRSAAGSDAGTEYDVLRDLDEGKLYDLSDFSYGSGGQSACVRRTPRLRPIDARTAGRGLSATPRGTRWRAANAGKGGKGGKGKGAKGASRRRRR